jgi:hypothetical protein
MEMDSGSSEKDSVISAQTGSPRLPKGLSLDRVFSTATCCLIETVIAHNCSRSVNERLRLFCFGSQVVY